MSVETDGFQGAAQSAVDPVVRELLQEHEEENSLRTATIVDIATISDTDPYENFSIDTSRITNSSQQRIKQIIETKKYEDCIALAVELESDDIFVDFFTYKSSPNTEYPSVESLAMKLGVDISSIHHLTGKTVEIHRQDGYWRVCETIETPQPTPTVTKNDFFNPLLIAGLLTPLGAIVGWQTTLPILATTIGGIALTITTYSFLLYLTLAAKRDHPLPGLLGRLFVPDYKNDAGVITDDDKFTDVEYGEFTGLHTLADEDEKDSDRAVLHNLAVDVSIPPSGEKTVPLPAPATGWDGTTVKGLVYSLSPSVETLERGAGELIPLKIEDDRVTVDKDRINVHPPRDLYVLEKLADMYVIKVNSLFGAKRREEVYH